VADRQQRRGTITPRIAGTLGCMAAAVLGYGAVTIIDRGHGAIGTQWRSAVVIGGGASIGLLALIAAVLALTRWRPRASRVLFPVAVGLAGALALIAWAGYPRGRRQRPCD
jgi:O-antigen ligase